MGAPPIACPAPIVPEGSSRLPSVPDSTGNKAGPAMPQSSLLMLAGVNGTGSSSSHHASGRHTGDDPTGSDSGKNSLRKMQHRAGAAGMLTVREEANVLRDLPLPKHAGKKRIAADSVGDADALAWQRLALALP
jgi:hypothetical protein